jgi:hypothetical protein
MDKETTILIIAQNGLRTAATLMSSQAIRLEKQASKTQNKQEAKNMQKKAAKKKKLAAALIAADEGIAAYMREAAAEG